MTKSYEIVRWDVLLDSHSVRRPAVYIKPDLKLMEYLREKQFYITLSLENVDIPYYDCYTSGEVNPSALAGGTRPNFFSETGLYVITLDRLTWKGYPNKLGNIQIKNLPVPEEIVKIRNMTTTSNDKLSNFSVKTTVILAILIILLLFLCLK